MAEQNIKSTIIKKQENNNIVSQTPKRLKIAISILSSCKNVQKLILKILFWTFLIVGHALYIIRKLASL